MQHLFERNAARRDSAATRTSPDPSTESQPRGIRRKHETRTRLLEAALQLMAKKGMEGVAINEITEVADVGFGSFYNHFESKDAIYTALIEHVFEDYADMLDLILRDLSDPAEVIAVAVRHTLMRARREPMWGHFLIREGFSARVLNHGLGQRLLRDTQRGIAEKRFFVADPFIGFLSLKGILLAAIAAELRLGMPAGDMPEEFSEGEYFAERISAAVLQMLGLEHAEADDIAMRPLPKWRAKVRTIGPSQRMPKKPA